MKELIKELVETYGPAGREDRVREVIAKRLGDREARTDALGNLIVRAGRTGGKRIMLAAHMDEIGLMVTHIEKEGFLRFERVGGLFPVRMPGQRVVFADGTVGVIGTEKIEDLKKDLKLEKMFIDIGAGSEEEAREKVEVGDIAVFHQPLVESGGRLISKAMDDRIGCAVLVQVLLELGECDHEVYFVFSTQEELGLRGATVSAFGIEPEMGLAVDVTLTGDTPGARTMDVSLGKGTAVKIMDRSIITHPMVKDLLIRRAEEKGIPYQREVLTAGGTDAGAIHLSRGGVASGVLSVPCRYVHSPSEMVDQGDVRATVDLLLTVLKSAID